MSYNYSKLYHNHLQLLTGCIGESTCQNKLISSRLCRAEIYRQVRRTVSPQVASFIDKIKATNIHLFARLTLWCETSYDQVLCLHSIFARGRKSPQSTMWQARNVRRSFGNTSLRLKTQTMTKIGCVWLGSRGWIGMSVLSIQKFISSLTWDCARELCYEVIIGQPKDISSCGS